MDNEEAMEQVKSTLKDYVDVVHNTSAKLSVDFFEQDWAAVAFDLQYLSTLGTSGERAAKLLALSEIVDLVVPEDVSKQLAEELPVDDTSGMFL